MSLLPSDRSSTRRRAPGAALGTLSDELEKWASAGRPASLWWRDDDAARPSDSLSRLLDLADRRGVPLALAVIPASAEAGLADAVGARQSVSVVQHGYAHVNHEPASAKKSEFGAARSPLEVRDDMARGRTRLDSLFGDRARPVFVPPWNRMDRRWLATLQDLGFAAVSRFQGAPRPDVGFGAIDCHVDIIDWHGTRGFVGEPGSVGRMVEHLAARREGRVADVPTGLLTHHLVHDAASWDFIDAMLAATARHSGARWVGIDEAIQP